MTNPLELRRTLELRCGQLAEEIYPQLSASEKRGVVFGLFPQAVMLEATNKLIGEHLVSEGRLPTPDECSQIARLLSVALMDRGNAP